MAASERLHGLDALRGIASLCVVGLHTQAIFGGYVNPLAKGYLAVDFFLMLSGFMMARTTEPRLSAGLNPAQFMLARYRRFWPTVAAGSVLGAPYLWFRAGGDLALFLPALAANLVMLPWPVAKLMFALNIPVWTIFAELLANAGHVFAFARFRTRTIAATTAILLIATLWVAADHGSLDVGARPATFAYAIPRVLLAYLLGVMLHRWRGDKPVRWLPWWLSLPALPGLMTIPHFTGWRSWIFDPGFVLLACPLVIVAALSLRRGTRIGYLAGLASFPLFAVHVPVLEATRELGFGIAYGLPAAFTIAGLVTWWTNRRARPMAAPSP